MTTAREVEEAIAAVTAPRFSSAGFADAIAAALRALSSRQEAIREELMAAIRKQEQWYAPTRFMDAPTTGTGTADDPIRPAPMLPKDATIVTLGVNDVFTPPGGTAPETIQAFREQMRPAPRAARPGDEMNAKVKNVRDLVPRFAKYLERNPAWGSLHVVLEDNNVDDICVRGAVKFAEEKNDTEGAALAKILLDCSKTQRLKLPDLCREVNRRAQADRDEAWRARVK